MKLSDLVDLIQTNHLPVPIFNTTVHIGNEVSLDNIYEFTPWRSGSSALGYTRLASGQFQNHELSRIMSISGAAVDSKVVDNKFWKKALEFTNANTGSEIPDIQQGSVYLTDGGHSENLGVFSLVRRGCKTILIVDAEHKPKREKRCEVDAINRIIKNLRSFDLDCSISDYSELHDGCIEEFQIGDIPYFDPKTKSVENLRLNVIYIRKALPQKAHRSNLECQGRRLNPSEKLLKYKRKLWNRRFPNHPTTTQNFPWRRYRAYRQLGYEYGIAATELIKRALTN